MTAAASAAGAASSTITSVDTDTTIGVRVVVDDSSWSLQATMCILFQLLRCNF